MSNASKLTLNVECILGKMAIVEIGKNCTKDPEVWPFTQKNSKEETVYEQQE